MKTTLLWWYFCLCLYRKNLCNCLYWFFLFSLLVSVFGGTCESFLSIFLYIVTQDACDQYQTNFIGRTEKKKSVRDVALVAILDVCGPWHVICFSYSRLPAFIASEKV